MSDVQKPRWLDTSVNVQTLVTGIVSAAIALMVVYFTLVQRVSKLEDHVSALETATTDQRKDTKESLRDISSSVKDVSAKVDALKDQLLQNSVSNRPDTKRWAR